jgi:hypothetical protein
MMIDDEAYTYLSTDNIVYGKITLMLRDFRYTYIYIWNKMIFFRKKKIRKTLMATLLLEMLKIKRKEEREMNLVKVKQRHKSMAWRVDLKSSGLSYESILSHDKTKN